MDICWGKKRGLKKDGNKDLSFLTGSVIGYPSYFYFEHLRLVGVLYLEMM